MSSLTWTGSSQLCWKVPVFRGTSATGMLSTIWSGSAQVCWKLLISGPISRWAVSSGFRTEACESYAKLFSGWASYWSLSNVGKPGGCCWRLFWANGLNPIWKKSGWAPSQLSCCRSWRSGSESQLKAGTGLLISAIANQVGALSRFCSVPLWVLIAQTQRSCGFRALFCSRCFKVRLIQRVSF